MGRERHTEVLPEDRQLRGGVLERGQPLHWWGRGG